MLARGTCAHMRVRDLSLEPATQYTTFACIETLAVEGAVYGACPLSAAPLGVGESYNEFEGK